MEIELKENESIDDLELKENESIDDLELDGLKIIQNKKYFKFGIDAVILSDFAKTIKANANVVDLGTGTGIIPILLSSKTKAKKITGIEIQEKVAQIAKRSIKLNKLENKIEIITADINEIDKLLEKGTFDTVVTNPPYQKENTGIISKIEEEQIARHEIKCNLETICRQAFKLLKNNGEIYMVHRPERIADILCSLRKYKIEPKLIRFVTSKTNSKPTLVLVKAVKDAKEFLNIEKNLVIYKENGEYTDEILKIYGKSKKEV